MKTINLKLYLILLIILIACLCLFSTAAFVLYQADNKSKLETAISATSIDQQLEKQLIFQTGKGFQPFGRFPDFSLWRESERSVGHCVRFVRVDGEIVKSACRDWQSTEQWPHWFKTIYQWRFQPGLEVERQVASGGQAYGSVIISPSAAMELTRAWQDVKKLMGLSAVMIVSLCTLLYFAVDWALRPARLIVASLESMAQGNLTTRLPDFHVSEWQRTGLAINHLAESLEKTISERKELALKLVNAQEEERRYLTRELHDEFGQSLAGLTAIAASITYTAEKECPKLVPEGQDIGRITTHLMESLRNLLIRLRPTDFDQLGLTKSLQCMVTGWNARSAGKISYKLDIDGDFDDLPDPIPVNVYRIVQECLTNISKHSAAKNARVKLQKSFNTEIADSVNSGESITLIIDDDGIAENIVFPDSPGIGLLGIRERVIALGGLLTLQANKPGGLIIHIEIPVQTTRYSSL